MEHEFKDTLPGAYKSTLMRDLDPPRYTQADRIIARFGGHRALADAVNRDVATVYKWSYPKARGGTDGLIPSSVMPEILKAAKEHGVFLSQSDLYPGRD